MNELTYNTWAKVQWSLDSLNKIARELETVCAEVEDYAAELADSMVEASDSEDFSEAVKKYEALARLNKEQRSS